MNDAKTVIDHVRNCNDLICEQDEDWALVAGAHFWDAAMRDAQSNNERIIRKYYGAVDSLNAFDAEFRIQMRKQWQQENDGTPFAVWIYTKMWAELSKCLRGKE